MKKLMYLIVAIVILGLIVSGCIPVVPPTEQGELGSQTKDSGTVTVQLLDSSNNGIVGGVVQYYSSGWQTFGTTGTDGKVSKDLPDGTYSFQMTYVGASMQKSQNVASDPDVVFNTTLVTMELLDSTGAALAGGAEYYASGWKTFGSGKTTTTMELLPVSYAFRVSYAGASMQKSQNVSSEPEVVFNTAQVHSVTNTCTQYYASGWKTFTQDMELLPGNYAFLFNDGTPQTSSTIVAGTVNNIH